MLDATPQSCFLLSPVLDRRRRGALKTDGARCTRAGSLSSDPAAARHGARSRSPAPSILALNPLAVPTHSHPRCLNRHRARRGLRRTLNAGSFPGGFRMPAPRPATTVTIAGIRNPSHTVPSRGTRRFGSEAVFGKLGVLQL